MAHLLIRYQAPSLLVCDSVFFLVRNLIYIARNLHTSYIHVHDSDKLFLMHNYAPVHACTNTKYIHVCTFLVSYLYLSYVGTNVTIEFQGTCNYTFDQDV